MHLIDRLLNRDVYWAAVVLLLSLGAAAVMLLL